MSRNHGNGFYIIVEPNEASQGSDEAFLKAQRLLQSEGALVLRDSSSIKPKSEVCRRRGGGMVEGSDSCSVHSLISSIQKKATLAGTNIVSGQIDGKTPLSENEWQDVAAEELTQQVAFHKHLKDQRKMAKHEPSRPIQLEGQSAAPSPSSLAKECWDSLILEESQCLRQNELRRVLKSPNSWLHGSDLTKLHAIVREKQKDNSKTLLLDTLPVTKRRSNHDNEQNKQEAMRMAVELEVLWANEQGQKKRREHGQSFPATKALDCLPFTLHLKNMLRRTPSDTEQGRKEIFRNQNTNESSLYVIFKEIKDPDMASDIIEVLHWLLTDLEADADSSNIRACLEGLKASERWHSLKVMLGEDRNKQLLDLLHLCAENDFSSLGPS